MSSLAKKLKNLKDLKDYKQGIDADTRDRIIIEYAPLIKFVAQKIASRLPPNIELDDLISCGVIGLMDAISKFDPTRDNKFKTYAEFRVRGAILDELRSQDWVPRSIREKTKQIERAYRKLESDFGRPATEEEMCAELKVSKEEYYEMLNKAKSVSVLNIDESSSFSRADRKLMASMMDKNKTVNPFIAVSSKDSREKLTNGIKDLPEKQRLVISLYYYEDLNLKEIGQVLDVTESRVSQLHTQAVLKLRSRLKSFFDSAEDLAI